jgi:hypothetical protein
MDYNKFDDHYDEEDEVMDDRRCTKCFKEVDKVCIGYPKPCITSIVEAFVKVEIKDKKIVKDCDGFTLIVKGCKYIKINYCSNDKCGCGKIFTEIFVVPFKQSIRFCGCYCELYDIDAFVKKCSVKKLSSRCACVTAEICLEVDLEEPKYESCDEDWDSSCKVQSCRCKD